ncbi:hypothetical protein KC968_04105 [Candidatus Saccharibacteria bacterium]|nr:hypothetical protein [Candidatus Saccharibacteria bacterium]
MVTKPKKSTKPTNKKYANKVSVKARLKRIPVRVRNKVVAKIRQKDKQPRPTKKLSGSFRLLIDSASLLRQHWKLFCGITLVYFFLIVLLAGGLSGLTSVKDLKSTFVQEFGNLTASLALFGMVVGTTGNTTSATGSIYQTLVVLIVSLATIWALRQILAGEKIRVRDAFYKGMYPLVPFVLVLLFICILFIPAMVSGFIFNVVILGGLAINVLELVLWMALIISLLLLTLYLVTTRIFAIYIVTLPDMQPVAAIKAAKKIVRYRRWAIIRKLLFLPFIMVIIAAIIILPLIVYAPVTVQVVFVLLSMFALVFAHTYAYSLYKELL